MTSDQPLRLAAPPEAMDSDPGVGEYMSTPVVGIVPSASLPVALRLMVARNVRHLPVVEGGRCAAIVSEIDLLHGLAAQHGPLGVTSLRVGDVARDVPAVSAASRLSEAAALMRDNATDAVLIDDDLGRVVGLVTATDLIRAMALHDRPASRRSATPNPS